MTAGPYSLSALYYEQAFDLLSGNVVVGQCKSAGQHHFCAACFSWLYTRPAGIDGMVNIRTPMLEQAAGFAPFAAFFQRESLPGTGSGAPVVFEDAPPVSEFLKLAEAYAKWDGRPN